MVVTESDLELLGWREKCITSETYYLGYVMSDCMSRFIDFQDDTYRNTKGVALLKLMTACQHLKAC